VASDVIIGAGSVVTPGKRLESGYLYVGNPARRARELRRMKSPASRDGGRLRDLKREYAQAAA
jgi:carbonic anhydrase/acetyltransferase-like protein (isoleucine patch superfamily)